MSETLPSLVIGVARTVWARLAQIVAMTSED